ncbi:hypothetical protein BGZ58_000739, partial [Dissophora ornata]
ECDLVLKIFPRLALPSADGESHWSQDVIAPCERCKAKKRDTFEVVGPDPAEPSPQRLFFSTGEVRLFFRIRCPPSHHTSTDENFGYILTFELHHGKRILMSETVKNAGPGMFPEPAELDSALDVSRPIKRKLSLSPSVFDSAGTDGIVDVDSLPRKRSTVMSLANLISDDPSSPGVNTEGSFTTASASADPSSPTTAVVPLSPMSYQHESDESGMRPRKKSPYYEDHAPSSWTYSKESRSGSERSEENQAKTTMGTTAAKPVKKRQEPHELSELGIGQRASANLHAAYVNGQLRERFSKTGIPADGFVVGVDGNTKPKNPSKPKPSHACPEPDCDKSFSRLFNLRSHMRTHSKARPFVCSSCNFAFSRRHDRDRHAKKHLSEKPYKCIVCEATFVRQDALVRHLRMDGVQNQCMAAMEQRSMLLSGENAGGYMLAAKQQAHDEQQQEDRKGADGRHTGALIRRQDISKDTSDLSENGDDQEDGDGAEDDEEQDDAEVEEVEGKARGLSKTMEKAGRPASRQQDAREDVAIRTVAAKGASLNERQTQAVAMSRPPSPHQERNGAHDADITEKNVGKQTPYTIPWNEKGGSGHQEYYADDRYGPMHPPHPRSFYPSPSRSHSRSHSQSQPYPMQQEYNGHGPYHDSPYPPPPPPHGYHGPQTKYQSVAAPQGHPYRDGPPSFGYPSAASSSSAPRYHERPPHDSRGYPGHSEHHGMDHFGAYLRRDSNYERPVESSSLGPQPWVPTNGPETHGDLSELEPDKSIFDAAVGLLRIRASQW